MRNARTEEGGDEAEARGGDAEDYCEGEGHCEEGWGGEGGRHGVGFYGGGGLYFVFFLDGIFCCRQSPI